MAPMQRISGALKGALTFVGSTAGRLAGLRRGQASDTKNTATDGESQEKPASMMKLVDDDWQQMIPGGGGG